MNWRRGIGICYLKVNSQRYSFFIVIIVKYSLTKQNPPVKVLPILMGVYRQREVALIEFYKVGLIFLICEMGANREDKLTKHISPGLLRSRLRGQIDPARDVFRKKIVRESEEGTRGGWESQETRQQPGDLVQEREGRKVW